MSAFSVIGRFKSGEFVYILLSERLIEKPYNDGKVAALVVGGQQDRVLVLLR